MPPKKSLGQNFLTSEAAIFKIVQAAKIFPEKSSDAPAETVLEIGPGRGVLTTALLDAGAHVIAIEKDRELVAELSAQPKFADAISVGKLKLIEADVLELSAEQLGLQAGGYKIVANLPYYITGQFLKKFLSEELSQPSLMVLLLQKEVVERIIAADKKESLLSISVKVYGQPRKVTVVNRGSFFPAPNVDSAVIAIENISKKFFAGRGLSEKNFFEILRAGFAHKRKMLISNLAEIAQRERLTEIFDSLKISLKIRAEDLTLEQWGDLAEKMSGLIF